MVIPFGKRYLKAVQQSCVQKEKANKYYKMIVREHLQKLLPQLWATCSVLLPKYQDCMRERGILWINCLTRMKSGFEWNLFPSRHFLFCWQHCLFLNRKALLQYTCQGRPDSASMWKAQENHSSDLNYLSGWWKQFLNPEVWMLWRMVQFSQPKLSNLIF